MVLIHFASSTSGITHVPSNLHFRPHLGACKFPHGSILCDSYRLLHARASIRMNPPRTPCFRHTHRPSPGSSRLGGGPSLPSASAAAPTPQCSALSSPVRRSNPANPGSASLARSEGGKRVAVVFGPTHGPEVGDYQLYDVKTGKLVSEVWGDAETQSLKTDAPDWAKHLQDRLRNSPGASP
jgi:hypothetical protein